MFRVYFYFPYLESLLSELRATATFGRMCPQATIFIFHFRFCLCAILSAGVGQNKEYVYKLIRLYKSDSNMFLKCNK